MQEKNLWVAVLLRAILDVHGISVGNPRRRKWIIRTARSWLKIESSQDLGSFSFVCGVLNFDPPTVRRRILKQRPKEIKLSLKTSPRFSGVSLRAPLTHFKSMPPRRELGNADFLG